MGSPYSASARRRINRVVRHVEGGALSGRGPGEYAAGQGLSIWLARAIATYGPNEDGSFIIQRPELVDSGFPDGPRTHKGYEVDDRSSDGTAETESYVNDVVAFVRDGICLEEGRYLLIEVCGAENAILEVLNPEKVVRCVADATVTTNNTGAFEVSARNGATTYSASALTITALNDLDVDIASGAVCTAVAERDGQDIRWRIVNADYTCP